LLGTYQVTHCTALLNRAHLSLNGKKLLIAGPPFPFSTTSK